MADLSCRIDLCHIWICQIVSWKIFSLQNDSPPTGQSASWVPVDLPVGGPGDFLVGGYLLFAASRIQWRFWLTVKIGAVVKNLPISVGSVRHVGSIPALGRSPGVRNGNLLQYSCLQNENPMDRGAWGLPSLGLQRIGHAWATEHITHTKITWQISLGFYFSLHYSPFPNFLPLFSPD